MSLKQIDGERWLVRVYNPHGREHRKIVRGKRAAIAHERMMKARLSSGDSRDEALARLPFSEYAEQWIAARNVKPVTRTGYVRLLRGVILPHVDDRRVGDWRHSDAAMFAASLAASGLAVSTQRRAHTLARSVLLAAVRDGVLDRNPFDGVRLPTQPRPTRQPVTWQDVAAMYAQAGEVGRLAVLLAGTGLRAGELCALTWDDVDVDRLVLRVRRTMTRLDPGQARAAGVDVTDYLAAPKSLSGVREVPLAPALAGLLARPRRLSWVSIPTWPGGRVERVALVLPSARAPWVTPNNLSSRVARAARTRGLRQQSPHDYRRLYAATLEQAGVPLATVQQVMGHAPVGVTLTHYVSVQPHTLELARSVVQAALVDILAA